MKDFAGNTRKNGVPVICPCFARPPWPIVCLGAGKQGGTNLLKHGRPATRPGGGNMSKAVRRQSWKWIAGLLLLIFLIGTGAAWLERRELMARYYIYCLGRAADDATRAVWCERIAR